MEKPIMAGIPPFITTRMTSSFLIRFRRSVLTSMPAMNITKTAPTEPRKIMAGVSWIRFKPNGPIIIPAIMSATT